MRRLLVEQVGKFTVKPDCAMLIMKQFGKPWTWRPWSVRTPSRHFSVSVSPSRPTISIAGAARVVGADLEAGREDEAVELVLAAVDDDALRRDALDAAALRVDERDVRAD